jgi:hypothetical protein
VLKVDRLKRWKSDSIDTRSFDAALKFHLHPMNRDFFDKIYKTLPFSTRIGAIYFRVLRVGAFYQTGRL